MDPPNRNDLRIDGKGLTWTESLRRLDAVDAPRNLVTGQKHGGVLSPYVERAHEKSVFTRFDRLQLIDDPEHSMNAEAVFAGYSPEQSITGQENVIAELLTSANSR